MTKFATISPEGVVVVVYLYDPRTTTETYTETVEVPVLEEIPQDVPASEGDGPTTPIRVVTRAVEIVKTREVPSGIDAEEIPDDVFAGWRKVGTAWEAPEAEPTPPPAKITRRQCAVEALYEGYLTNEEARLMATQATPPAAVEAFLVTLPEPAQTVARIDFGASDYERASATFNAVILAIKPDATSSDIDTFMRSAATR